MAYYKKWFLVLVVVFFVIEVSVAADDSGLTRKGINLTMNMQFEQAIAMFDSLISKDERNPAGYFYKSAVYFWMYTENYGDETLGEEFEKHSFNAVEIGEARLEENESDIDALFYLGGVYGNLGRYYVITQNWLKAYWYGRKGKNYLEEVVEINPEYYEAYLGLGIYHYYADILPGFIKALSFLLGIEGDKAKGLEELNLAIEKGTYTKNEARFFLAMTYLFIENDYRKAQKLYKTLSEQCPQNGAFLNALGRTYLNLKHDKEALEVFEHVISSGISRPKFSQNQANYFIGEIYYKRNKFKKALPYLQKSTKNTIRTNDKHYWTFGWGGMKLAECYDILGKREDAMQVYQKIINANVNRASEQARERIEKPMHAIDFKLIIAGNYLESARYDSSMTILNELLSEINSSDDPYLKSKLTEVNYNQGRIYSARLRYKNAIDIFRKILDFEEIEPGWIEPWTHYYLAEALSKTGRSEEAKHHYDEASDSENPRLSLKIKMALSKIEDKLD